MKRILYGVCRDGLIYSMRAEGFGATGLMRWRHIFNVEERRKLWANMAAALIVMLKDAAAPSKNALKRARRRG